MSKKDFMDDMSKVFENYKTAHRRSPKRVGKRYYAIEYGDKDTKISSENATAIYKGMVTDEELATLLSDPLRNAKTLREISKLYYYKMPIYRLLISYHASLEEWNYGLNPVYNPEEVNSPDEILQKFHETSSVLNRLIKKKVMKKIKARVLTYGAFFGFVIEGDAEKDYSVIEFPPEFCQIVAMRDGNYIYALDMKYFDKDLELLETLPPIFSELYNKADSSDSFQIIDDPHAICIKGDSLSETEILPVYISLFPDLYDLADAKTKRMVGRIIESYKMLHLKLPMGSTRNEFLVDPTFAYETFFFDAADALPEEMGIIMNPMESKVIDFSSNLEKGDDVGKVFNDVMNGTGVSGNLFNTSSQVTDGLSYSTKVDVAVNSFILDQIEDWVNAFIKELGLGDYFQFELFDVTRFDKEEKVKGQLELGKFGFPNKLRTLYMSGVKPVELAATLNFENEILNLAESFVPLSSSHTLSGSVERTKDKIEGADGASDTEAKDNESGELDEKAED